MMFNKKAQGMSLNVVVIAVLVILVLVVLAIIFTTQTGKTGKELQGCIATGGLCKAECNTDTEAQGREGVYSCPENTVCCFDKDLAASRGLQTELI
ncbi:hypothetical protein KY335_04745 [Candidatus Woesearchaeota archaeon]|nr:hypothetical protein [Candidatus Woesearchaeota archaeon]